MIEEEEIFNSHDVVSVHQHGLLEGIRSKFENDSTLRNKT